MYCDKCSYNCVPQCRLSQLYFPDPNPLSLKIELGSSVSLRKCAHHKRVGCVSMSMKHSQEIDVFFARKFTENILS